MKGNQESCDLCQVLVPFPLTWDMKQPGALLALFGIAESAVKNWQAAKKLMLVNGGYKSEARGG